jgi:hypothetical protein
MNTTQRTVQQEHQQNTRYSTTVTVTRCTVQYNCDSNMMHGTTVKKVKKTVITLPMDTSETRNSLFKPFLGKAEIEGRRNSQNFHLFIDSNKHYITLTLESIKMCWNKNTLARVVNCIAYQVLIFIWAWKFRWVLKLLRNCFYITIGIYLLNVIWYDMIWYDWVVTRWQ